MRDGESRVYRSPRCESSTSALVGRLARVPLVASVQPACSINPSIEITPESRIRVQPAGPASRIGKTPLTAQPKGSGASATSDLCADVWRGGTTESRAVRPQWTIQGQQSPASQGQSPSSRSSAADVYATPLQPRDGDIALRMGVLALTLLATGRKLDEVSLRRAFRQLPNPWIQPR